MSAPEIAALPIEKAEARATLALLDGLAGVFLDWADAVPPERRSACMQVGRDLVSGMASGMGATPDECTALVAHLFPEGP